MNVTNEQDETSLGYILQQAREQRGLTQAQAAMQLNLKISVIAQMEAEQWDQSVAPTFMRGYLRSYARLLKLSEAEILQAFAVQTAYLRHHPKEMKSFSNKTRRDAAESRFMLATYFVGVLLLGLLLVSAWQTQMLDDKPVSVLPEYNESAELPVTAVPSLPQQVSSTASTNNKTQETAAPVSSDQALATMTTEDQSSASQNQSAVATVNSPTTNMTSENVAATSPAASEQVTSPPVVREDAAENTVVTASSQAEPESMETAVNTDASDARGRLTMQFSKGCWVSVEDSTGKRLTYQMYQAGQEAQISGVFPLKVTLGEPTAVTLQLNDVSIDLSQYQTGRVARLTFNGPA